MVHLYRVSWIFLIFTISYTSRLNAEVKKDHKFKIDWSLSAAICVQRGAFERNKKIQPPLNQVAAYESRGKQLCLHITRTHCDAEYTICKKFQCKNNQGSGDVGVDIQPSISSKKQKSSQTNTRPGRGPRTRTGPYIIVRMKSQHKCEALPIPACLDPDDCIVLPIDRAFQAESVADSLKAHATKSQASVLDILKSISLRSAQSSTEQLWITNEIIVKGASLSDVQKILKGHSEVEEVRAERLYRIPEASSKFSGKDTVRLENLNSESQKTKSGKDGDNWHITTIEADKVWQEGITGKGIFVGHIDTGAFGGHESLKSNFRGEYGWFDPCFMQPEPYDDEGHGTHTLGTAVGQTRKLGVAPGATWMSCKGCREDGECPESATKTCAQWILCPTKWDGTDPDCSKAPHIVTNSWGEEPRADESDAPFQEEYEQLIQCWRSAGIIPVFSIGNSGYKCGTAYYPGLSDKVIGVGNVGRIYKDPKNRVNYTLEAYGESSRGPPRPRYKQLIKPDVSAPGENILSGIQDENNNTDTYYITSGTSMAAPQVAGTIALMLEKNPSLQFDAISDALTRSCSPVQIPSSVEQCGNIPLAVYPNHHIGYGLVNSFKAVFGTETSEEEC